MILRATPAIAVAVFFCFCGAYQPIAAQTAIKPLTRPDPASISVPNLALAPNEKNSGESDSYFYFYKSGVTYEAAFNDLDQCRMYALEIGFMSPPPKFVPLGGEILKDDTKWQINGGFQYGVVGAVIAEMAIQATQENITLGTKRKCMAYKGYSRYGTSSDKWQQVDTGTDAEKIARLALIASGPKPDAEAIGP